MLPRGPAVQLVYPHLLPTHVIPSVILNVEAEVCRTLVRLLEAEAERLAVCVHSKAYKGWISYIKEINILAFFDIIFN